MREPAVQPIELHSRRLMVPELAVRAVVLRMRRLMIMRQEPAVEPDVV